MATKDVIQATKTGRRTTGGDSEFHLWRIRHSLTQISCASLFDVAHTTIQRWDANEHAAPSLLEPALAYHTLMRAEILDVLRPELDVRDRIGLQGDNLAGLDWDDLILELGLDVRNHPLASFIEVLSPSQRAAVLYGIKHGLWR